MEVQEGEDEGFEEDEEGFEEDHEGAYSKGADEDKSSLSQGKGPRVVRSTVDIQLFP